MWRIAVAVECLVKPSHPQLVTVRQERQNLVVFAGKVPVKRDLGHARLGNHPVDARGTDAVSVEQIVGREQDALAGAERCVSTPKPLRPV